MNKIRLILLAAFTLSCGPQAYAQVPSSRRLLGEATYQTMPLNALAAPKVIWADYDLAREKKITHTGDSVQTANKKISDKVGYASQVDGEQDNVYSPKTVLSYVDAYGGLGMNGNFGSGRAAIVGDWQIKGSGKTMMVNKHSDQYHRSGASVMREGIWEAAWSKLLAKELPYGAYEMLAVIATGSNATLHGNHFEPRVLIVREDPVRPAHFVLNPTAVLENDGQERIRVAQAMRRIVEALPKPEGFVSTGRTADFRAGVFEFIHRQAYQHGYAWAWSLFHGGTSPSNTGLDGRMLDFGSYSAFDGFPKARVMDEDGFFGDTELYKRDLLKDIRDSWLTTLPPDLLAALPSEQEWFAQFEKSFQQARHLEMLRLAGAMTELAPDLAKSAAGQRLAKLLIVIAESGQQALEVWKGESPFGTGQYHLGKILNALASLPVSQLSAGDPVLAGLIPDSGLRSDLVAKYRAAFAQQQKLALRHGIAEDGEASYRRTAAQFRNQKMESMFRNPVNEEKITAAIQSFQASGDARVVQNLIDGMVSQARREFRDAAPFTLVLSESVRPDGTIARDVLDAKQGGRVVTRLRRSGAAHAKLHKMCMESLAVAQ